MVSVRFIVLVKGLGLCFNSGLGLGIGLKD